MTGVLDDDAVRVGNMLRAGFNTNYTSSWHMVRTAPLTTNSSDVLTVQTDTDDAIVPHGDDMEQSEVSANNVPMRGDTAPSNSDRVILVTTPLTGVWGAQTPIPKPCRV